MVENQDLMVESAVIALESVGIGVRFLNSSYADSDGNVTSIIVELTDLKVGF